MRRMLGLGAQKFEIMKGSELRPDETPMAFNQITGQNFIRQFMYDPSTNRILRNLLAEVASFGILAKLGDQEVTAQLARQLVSGGIKVVPFGQIQTAGKTTKPEEKEKQEEAPPAPVMAATAQDDIHWIRFEIVDINDKPVAGAKLELKLPNKDPKPKSYNAGPKGIVFIEKLSPGSCDIKSISGTEGYEIVE